MILAASYQSANLQINADLAGIYADLGALYGCP